jgi:hypothetical protein
VALFPGQHVGQVLVELAAVGDSQQFHPPAHAEHRQVGVQGRVEHGQFARVPVRPGHGEPVLRRAVAGRVDVGPAGQHQPVETADQVGGAGLVGWQHHRAGAGFAHHPHIAFRDEHSGLIPDAPPRLLHIGRDPDDRRAHSGVT